MQFMLWCMRSTTSSSASLLRAIRNTRLSRTSHVQLNSTRALSASSNPPRKTIFSGIQPTGVPHLGNYLGALRQWVRLQNEAAPDTRLLYSLVDLHAITVRQDPDQLRQWKNESLAMLLAIGLDPKRSIIFFQSQVYAHCEMMWILSCQASTGYLGRMTQWKDKTTNEKANSEKLKLGLFSYPVLQAADVLVHASTHVPVGHDQAQHLEFARDLANGFNHNYGKNILVPPETLISPAKRVMSLTDPTAKMSKSHPNPKSRILLTDDKETIESKIRTAVTDSIDGITYEPERRPGVSNLIEILYHLLEAPPPSGPGALVDEFRGTSLRAFKDLVSAAVEQTVQPIRERYAMIVDDRKTLVNLAMDGARGAASGANVTIREVKRAIGLSY